MELISPKSIPLIDKYCITALGIPEYELMRRSAVALKSGVERLVCHGARVLILAGKGNNGGDGYALATMLLGSYKVTVCDLFSAGQKSEAGRRFREEFSRLGGEIRPGIPSGEELFSADLIVDAVFGTGALGEPPSELIPLIRDVNSSPAKRLAVDIPLGVNAEDGSVSENAVRADLTVTLSFAKTGLLSYPAREYVGELISDPLSLDSSDLLRHFPTKNHYIDFSYALANLPMRDKNTNKGSFGKALLVTGSEEFEGAGRLSLEAALRGGCGIVIHASPEPLRNRLISDYPEAIYKPYERLDGDTVSRICDLSASTSATLIGSGSGNSPALFALVRSLILTKGGPLVLDADAINSISKYGSPELLLQAERRLILTPHPLELSRLIGKSADHIQANRISVSRSFASEYGCILLLKGAATVITDGDAVLINSTGSSALSKGGSGDVLAGLLVSLLAMGTESLSATALAAYLHGAAGDSLAKRYSDFGVTPSDLPKEIAGELALLTKKQ